MATMNLVSGYGVVDLDTGEVTLIWTEGLPQGHPDPINWQPEHRIQITLPGVAVVSLLHPAPEPPVEDTPASPGEDNSPSVDD